MDPQWRPVAAEQPRLENQLPSLLAPQPHISQVYHALAVSHLVLGDAWGSHLRLDGHTGGFIII